MFKFTIRDLLWLTVVVAILVSWRLAESEHDKTNAGNEVAYRKLLDASTQKQYDIAFDALSRLDNTSDGSTAGKLPLPPAWHHAPAPGVHCHPQLIVHPDGQSVLWPKGRRFTVSTSIQLLGIGCGLAFRTKSGVAARRHREMPLIFAHKHRSLCSTNAQSL